MPKLVIGGQIVPTRRARLLELGFQTSPNGNIETTLHEVLSLIGDNDDA